MVQGNWGKLLSRAQYHLTTVHLFSRADYLTVIPTVRPFLTYPTLFEVNFNGSFRFRLQSLYQTARRNGHL